MPSPSSTFCIALFGYVQVLGRGGPAQSNVIAGPVMIFTDEVIWIKPPVRRRFGLAARTLIDKAGGDPYSDPYKEEIVKQLNGTVKALVVGIGGEKLTSADVHEQFGEWCDAQPNSDITQVTITKKGWINPVTRVTFYSQGSITRHADVSPVPSARSAVISDLTKAFGARVVVK